MTTPTRFQAWQRHIDARISERGRRWVEFIGKHGIDENTLLLMLAMVIGGGVGAAVIGFYELIDLVQALALSAAGRMTGPESLAILVIALGGLGLTRLLIVKGTGDSDGENIPDVTLAVAKRGSVVHTTPVAVKTLGAAIAIGTGGSVGAEGPVAVAGAAMGSRFGRFFRSSPARLKLFIACGSAAGISAAFNAPIGGVFFALEKVLGSMSVSAFPPVLVSSVMATVVARSVFGNTPVIEIPTEYGVGAASELILYALLGVAAGIVAVIYTRGVHSAAAHLKRFPNRILQIAVAGLIVGGLDIFFRADLWGHGHESFSLAIIGQRDALFLLALAFAKLIATATTVGATKAGGLFTPALFIGATLGGGLALAAQPVLPQFHIVPEAFALAGMAALVAGSTHAPLTAIMIVFEMTSDYALILPLMLSCAVAFITARKLHPNSIYSEWLARRGEKITSGQDVSALERLKVRDSYDKQVEVINEAATARQIMQSLSRTSQMEFPVVDDQQNLIGMIAYNDIRALLAEPDMLGHVVVAGDIVDERFESVTPDDSLKTALQKLAVRGNQYLPVVDSRNGRRLLGILGRQQIFAAYDREFLNPASP